jgi:hypothetical protein
MCVFIEMNGKGDFAFFLRMHLEKGARENENAISRG